MFLVHFGLVQLPKDKKIRRKLKQVSQSRSILQPEASVNAAASLINRENEVCVCGRGRMPGKSTCKNCENFLVNNLYFICYNLFFKTLNNNGNRILWIC